MLPFGAFKIISPTIKNVHYAKLWIAMIATATKYLQAENNKALLVLLHTGPDQGP